MKYLQEKDFILSNIKRAYNKFAKASGFETSQKGKFDLVTDVDKNIESYLKEAIYANYPNDNIISEETLPLARIENRTWIIDPVDGTVNMAHGIPVFGVQCALVDGGEIVLSVLFLPCVGEEYYAIKGCGAYLNGEKIHVSDPQIHSSVISFGDYSHKSEEYAKRQYKAVGAIYPQISKMRLFGAACVDFTSMASGKTDATVILTNNLWDICPGILLCSEAGAIITDVDGNDYKFGTFGVVAAANKELHNLIIKAFS